MPELPASDDWRRLARALVAGADDAPVDLGGASDARLLDTAGPQGIAPLLDLRAEQGRITGISPTVRSALRDAAHRTAARDLALEHALAELDRHLVAQGLEALLLKGGVLARTVYPERRLRPCSDLDLWIRREDTAAMMETLRTFDYRLANDDVDRRASHQFQATRSAFEGESLWFDIHYGLSNRTLFTQALDFSACRDRALQRPGATPGASAILMLAPAELLLHLCLHRLAHGRGSDRFRLIWLYDIHLLYGAMDEGERLRFTDLALDQRFGCVCADALETVRHAFGTAVSDRRLATLRQRRDREPTAGLLSAGKWRWGWADLAAQESWGARWSFLKEVLTNQR